MGGGEGQRAICSASKSQASQTLGLVIVDRAAIDRDQELRIKMAMSIPTDDWLPLKSRSPHDQKTVLVN
jgi:hypothetical protein